MATINGLYVFVQNEGLDQSVERSVHPVENGADLVDHVKKKPLQLSISGEIVGPNAAQVKEQLAALMYTGALVRYVGRNACQTMQVEQFSTAHPYTIKGGMTFSAVLKEAPVAKSAVPPTGADTATKGDTRAGTQQAEGTADGTKAYHTVKVGETAWYLGEKVYKAQGSSVSFIIEHNPNAPRKRGDWTTLAVGTRLHVYNRKGAVG